jgi:hypothetical protein
MNLVVRFQTEHPQFSITGLGLVKDDDLYADIQNRITNAEDYLRDSGKRLLEKIKEPK